MIVAAAVYRIVPFRPFGFAPQIAMALFGGAVIKDRKLAFALPLFSMFVSDALYEVLYRNGLSPIKGLYSGQWLNYLEIASVVLIGMLMKKINLKSVLGYSFVAPTWYFLLSNFTVWVGNSTYPQTPSGLFSCLAAGIPFYGWSVVATLFFSGVFFGAYYLLQVRRTSSSLA